MFLYNAFLLVLGVVLLLIDLFAGAVLILAVSLSVPLVLGGTEVTGHVVTIERSRPGRPARVRVAYQTPGGTFETTGSTRNPRIGEPKTVRYNPARPARATTMTRPGRTAAIGIPIVLIIAGLSAGMIIGSVWYFAGVHRQLQTRLGFGSMLLTFALGAGWYAVTQYGKVLRWRRMAQAAGKVKRFTEHSPVGPGILISFDSAGSENEFWARAGSVPAGVGDTVTVYYDPGKPATSATVDTAATVRTQAIGATVLTLIMVVIGVAGIISLR